MTEYQTEKKQEYKLNSIGSKFKTGALWLGMAAFTVTPMMGNSQNYNSKGVSLEEVQNLEFLGNSSSPNAPTEDYTKNIESYIGVPVAGDYDDNPDLDFRMQFMDDGVLYDVYVHEEADGSNIDNLNKVRELVEDAYVNEGFIYVRGKLKERGNIKYDEETGQKTQRAKINPFYVGAVDSETGETKPVFTEGTGSPLYTVDDYTADYIFWEPGPVRIVWSSGWSHYPYGFSPSWDVDGDGIPNWRDPAPYVFGPYVDMNHNGIIDAWDITATGAWGWYGNYWYYHYPQDHWWFAHDHWYCQGGWYDWHHHGHHHSPGHKPGDDNGHYYGPRKGFSHNGVEQVRGERKINNKPSIQITRDTRFVDDGNKVIIQHPRSSKTNLEKTVNKDPRSKTQSRSSKEIKQGRQEIDDVYKTRERNIKTKTYERNKEATQTKPQYKPKQRYEKPKDYKPVQKRDNKTYQRQPTQQPKQRNNSYTKPTNTQRNNNNSYKPRSNVYSQPSRSNNKSYSSPSRSNNKSYSSPSRSSKSNSSYSKPSNTRSSGSKSSPSRSSTGTRGGRK